MVRKNVTHFLLIADVCVLNFYQFVPLITFTVNKQSQIFVFLEPHAALLHISGLVCFSVSVGFNGGG